MQVNATQLPENHPLYALIANGGNGSYIHVDQDNSAYRDSEVNALIGAFVIDNNDVSYRLRRDRTVAAGSVWMLVRHSDEWNGDNVYVHAGLRGQSLAKDLGYKCVTDRFSPYLPIAIIPWKDYKTFCEMLNDYGEADAELRMTYTADILARTLVG